MINVVEDSSCENCRFFVMMKNPMGECHRYAPQPRVIAVAKGQVEANQDGFEPADAIEAVIVWPAVHVDDECGEWQASR